MGIAKLCAEEDSMRILVALGMMLAIAAAMPHDLGTKDFVTEVEDVLDGRSSIGEDAGQVVNTRQLMVDRANSECISKGTDEYMAQCCIDRPKMHCNGGMRDWFCNMMDDTMEAEIEKNTDVEGCVSG